VSLLVGTPVAARAADDARPKDNKHDDRQLHREHRWRVEPGEDRDVHGDEDRDGDHKRSDCSAPALLLHHALILPDLRTLAWGAALVPAVDQEIVCIGSAAQNEAARGR
jgi:hypothetical protein